MFCSRKMNNRINHRHERVLRLVYDDYTNSFETLLLIDKTVCVHHRNIQKVALEMYKVKHHLSPNLICDIFDIKDNGRNKRDFFRPRVTSVYKGINSLRNFGPIVWNTMLPEELKSENVQTRNKNVDTRKLPM